MTALSMQCVGKDDRDPDDSSLDNDILFIDVNSAPSKSSQKPLTTSNLAAHVESSPPSKAVIQNRPSALNTSNIAILRPSNFNSSLAVNKGSKISTQKYGGAVGDTTFRLDSCEDVEDISEDDDEGDLNDLYAENMRMIDADVSTVVSVLKNASTTPRSVQHEIEKAPLNKNKSAPSALTTRISSSDFRDFETSSPKSDLRSRGSLMDNSTNVTEKKSVPGLKNNSCGGATDLTDNELIEMLNKPPKTTYALRTKSNFQEFFRGMDAQRMKALLERAYSGEDNVAKRQEKVVKRMELLRDVLV